MYQEAFSRFEIEAIVPTSIDQEELVMEAIQGASGVKTGGNLNAARRLIGRAGRDLIGREAEALLIACTELSLLYPPRIHGWNVPVIDAAQVAAERVIVLAEREVKDAAVQP
jgi:aspartate/glutamate racemase